MESTSKIQHAGKPRKHNKATKTNIQTDIPKTYTITTNRTIRKTITSPVSSNKPKTSDSPNDVIEVLQTIKTEQETETYPTRPVLPTINQKLQRLDRTRGVLTFEIAPGTGNDKIRLLTQLIGPYVIRYMRPMTRVYRCTYIEQRTKALYRYKIADIGDTVGNIIQKLQDNGIKIYLHGGIVRDMFLGVRSADIDTIFDTNLNVIQDLCQDNNWPCTDMDPRFQYINFGKDKGISLEGSNLKGVFMVMPHKREATVNDLCVDLQTGLLIDISGFGLQDVLNKRLRISPIPKYWDKWATQDWKKPLRYFKLIQKGFKPINQATHSFVIKYICDNWDNVYEHPVNPPSYMTRRIKHFLIKTMTQGTLDKDTGEYEFGPTEDKLIPYLQTLRLHLGKHIFNRAIAQFTDDDIAMLKDASVISSLRKYKEAQHKSDQELIARQKYLAKTKRAKKAKSNKKTKKNKA